MEVGVYIGIGTAALVVLYAIVTYNKLAKKKLSIEGNYSQIKIQCKKRFDLVPHLVEAVKGYAKHEKEVLEKLGAKRTYETPQQLAEANGQLSNALNNLSASPELKTNQSFVKLQNELASIEKAIAISRQIYNDSVMIYNRSVKAFPGSIFAAVFKFKKMQFFDVTEEGNFKLNLESACQYCGAKLSPSSIKCPNCGSNL